MAKDTRDRREEKRIYAETHKEQIKEKNKRIYERQKEKRIAYSKEYVKNNKEIVSIRRKAYYQSHKEEIAQKAKEAFQTRRITQYGISVSDYNDMFSAQGGRCAICGIHESEHNGKLHIDHDHETKIVRGLLCGKCNKALGLFSDNIDMLQSAINYLKGRKL
jgi:hypothetical protein